MAATVTLNEHNSAVAGTRTDKTSGVVRCKAADDATVDVNNPLQKPAPAGTTRSFEKWLKLRIGGTGPSGNITNVQFYTTGTPSTGADVYARVTNPTVYATPVVPANETGAALASSFTSGSRKSMSTGTFTTPNTDIGDFLVLWMKLIDTVVAPGTTNNINLFLSYDET